MKDNEVCLFSEEYDGKEKKDYIVTSQEEEGLLMSWQSSQNTFTLAWQYGLGKDVSKNFKYDEAFPKKCFKASFT